MPIETFQNFSNFTNDVTANTLYVTSRILSGNTDVIQVISSVVNNSPSNTTTTLNSNSADWIGGNSAYTTLNLNSADWISTETVVASNSSSWINTTTTLNSISTTYVYLSSQGAAIGAGAATNVGLRTFSLEANGVYEVIYDLWLSKTTTSTVVYLLSGSNTYANVNGRAIHTIAAGTSAFSAPTLVHITNKTLAVTPFPATATLTTINTHSVSITYNIINGSSANTIQIAVSCPNVATVTPLIGCQGKITRLR